MSAYNENVAYDLSLFEPRKPKLKKIETPKTQKKVKVISPVKIVAVAVFVVSLLSVMIYSRVMLTEITDSINTSQKVLAELESENIRMSVELESGSAIGNIDEVAAQYGLGKIEQYQIEYIDVNNADKIIVSEAANKGIIDRAIDFINKLLG